MKRRTHLIARIALAAFISSCARSQTPAAPARATADERAAGDEVGARTTIAAWREALELDLPAEVLAGGPASVAPGAALAGEGEAIALVARALSAAGADEKAQTLLETAQPNAQTRAFVEIARARLAIERDDLNRALKLLERRKADPADPKGARPLPVAYPEVPECWLLLGRALSRAGQAQEAAPVLARFLEVAPLDAEAPAAWHMLAQAAIQRRDLSTARELEEKARASAQWQAFYKTRRLQIRANPAEPLPRLGLAQLFLSVDEAARAKVIVQATLAIAPDTCRALDLLGECERKLGDRATARAAYDRALACDPALPEAHFNRGMLALLEKRDADARSDLEWVTSSAASSEPRFLRAHLELARLLRAAGERDAARERYARYSALGGKDPLEAR